MAFSADGALLATCDLNMVRVWDAATGCLVQQFSADSIHVCSVAFLGDGATLVTAGMAPWLTLWESATGKQLRAMSAGHRARPFFVTVSPDGNFIATAGDEEPPPAPGQSRPAILQPKHYSVRLRDVASGRELGLRCIGGGHATFSPDSTSLVWTGFNKQLHFCDISTGKEIRLLGDPTKDSASFAFSPDGKALAVVDADAVQLLDGQTGDEIWRFARAEKGALPFAPIAFSPDGKALAVSESDAVQLLDGQTGDELQRFPRPQAFAGFRCMKLCCTSNGDIIMAGVGNGTFGLWNVRSGKELHWVSKHADQVSTLAFSHDGTTLAIGWYDRLLRLIDLRDLN